MSNKKAFTLIELLMVIAIIGILSGLMVVSLNGAKNAANDTKRKADIGLIANAVASYSSENYSTKPIATTSCTINGTCPSTINDSLKPFLATLPSDPNSGTYYTYQSDGSDCTISATLSNGQVYQYTCSTDKAVSVTPSNGVCGITSAYTLNSGSAGLCNPGTVSGFTGSSSGPWSWTCNGSNGGNPSGTCTANMSVDGVCGGSGPYLTLSNGTCTQGTVSGFNGGSGPWTWTCNGSNGGVSPTCTASLNDCAAAGGSLSTCGGSVPCCIFGGASSWTASCPSGWTYVTGWYACDYVAPYYAVPQFCTSISNCYNGNYQQAVYPSVVGWGYHSTETEGGVTYCSVYLNSVCTTHATIYPIHTRIGCQ